MEQLALEKRENRKRKSRPSTQMRTVIQNNSKPPCWQELSAQRQPTLSLHHQILQPILKPSALARVLRQPPLEWTHRRSSKRFLRIRIRIRVIRPCQHQVSLLPPICVLEDFLRFPLLLVRISVCTPLQGWKLSASALSPLK
jgi:hypothetical protein